MKKYLIIKQDSTKTLPVRIKGKAEYCNIKYEILEFPKYNIFQRIWKKIWNKIWKKKWPIVKRIEIIDEIPNGIYKISNLPKYIKVPDNLGYTETSYRPAEFISNSTYGGTHYKVTRISKYEVSIEGYSHIKI